MVLNLAAAQEVMKLKAVMVVLMAAVVAQVVFIPEVIQVEQVVTMAGPAALLRKMALMEQIPPILPI